MRISYNKLWKMLIDKNMKKSDLKEKAGILCTAAEDYYKNNKEKFDFIKYSIEDDRPNTFL